VLDRHAGKVRSLPNGGPCPDPESVFKQTARTQAAQKAVEAKLKPPAPQTSAQ
jgi:hypothetical protein